jgi:hypothetical protein
VRPLVCGGSRCKPIPPVGGPTSSPVLAGVEGYDSFVESEKVEANAWRSLDVDERRVRLYARSMGMPHEEARFWVEDEGIGEALGFLEDDIEKTLREI